MLTKSRQIISS
uniref:Uncharacterized protein n=1 Tax=Arundo donax TaxID=35708 RepID=A0A0A8XXG2_ARUDO